ncbi:MAG: class I SAM-dependent methyltransferase [Rhodospirillales bacterium]|nr:class I SAM-dependent methyltransferase [Rhodospirillales bacterium]
MFIELISLALALLLIAMVFIPVLLTGAPPVPTSFSVRTALMGLLPRRLPGPATGVIYELGSGWGGMALKLAEMYPDHQVIGFELSPLPWLVARLRLAVSGHRNLRFRLADYNRQDLSNASLVLCYLLPDLMQNLQRKLAAELTPGTLIVSNTFAFRGWRPLDDRIADDIYKSPVYLYEFGRTEEA